MDAESSLGSSEQALTESIVDRPAAAVDRIVDGREETWVFACGSDHVMKRRVRGPDGIWSRWFTVNTSYPCNATPTVGIFKGEQPRESVGVYWRSGSSLIEGWYPNSGSGQVTNLSELLALDPIAGTPRVVHSINLSNASQRISVAYQSTNREIYTLDYFQSSWHVRPVMTATNTVAKVYEYSNSFTVFNGNTLRGGWLSFQTGITTHTVYTRTSWNDSYREYATAEAEPNLSILGNIAFSNNPDRCSGAPCLLVHFWPPAYPNPRTIWGGLGKGLAAGGRVTENVTNWNIVGDKFAGSPEGSPDHKLQLVRLSSGGLGMASGADVAGDSGNEFADLGGVVDTAPSFVLRPSTDPVFFYGQKPTGSNTYRLWRYDFPTGWHMSMELDIVTP